MSDQKGHISEGQMSIISVSHYNSRLNDTGALNYTFQEVKNNNKKRFDFEISENLQMYTEIKFKSCHMGAKFWHGTE